MLRRSPFGSPATQPSADRMRGGLGPRGQSVFERLFGQAPQPAAPVLQREAPIIAVASGKGGTGKSFLTTSLAVLCHGRALRTAIVDCDFGLACDHLLLGVKPTLHLQHVLQRRARLDEILAVTPHGPTLVPGAAGVRQMARLTDPEIEAFGRTLGELASAHDAVLLDIGAGLSPQNVLTCCAADFVVLVTQPEIAALTDAYAVIKTLATLGAAKRIGIVVNRVLEASHGQSTFEKLRDVASRHTGLELCDLGALPEDPLVTQRRLGQAPLCVTEPQSPTVHALQRVCDRILALVGPMRPRERAADATVAARFAEFQRVV
ncbi:MAG: P-loop NTPase [Planctomycetes bacterium]|nr:P-loop NTPase [Planctomycetota bacterium]